MWAVVMSASLLRISRPSSHLVRLVTVLNTLILTVSYGKILWHGVKANLKKYPTDYDDRVTLDGNRLPEQN